MQSLESAGHRAKCSMPHSQYSCRHLKSSYIWVIKLLIPTLKNYVKIFPTAVNEGNILKLCKGFIVNLII